MDIQFVEKCRNRLKRITDSTIYTNHVFSVLMQIRDFQEKYNDLINISPAYYQCVINNCFEVLFIEIYKMFDPKTSSDGILGLLNTMQNSIGQLENKLPIIVNITDGLDDNIWDEFEYKNIEQLINMTLKSITDHKETIDKIKVQRDKYYAHLDKDIKNDFFEKHPVSVNDLETLLILNTNIVNALNMYFNHKTIMPMISNSTDFSKTVYYIKKGVKAQKELDG